MNGFALVAGGLRGVNNLRRWVPDAKTALYLAHDAMQAWPVVLVHEARKPGSTIAAEGAAPVFKANVLEISIDKLS